MTFFVWVLVVFETWLGLRGLGNLVGLLRTSKYATGTTAVFTVACLAAAGAGIWFVTGGNDPGLALLVTLGPWALVVLVLFVTLLTGNYQ